MRGKIGVYLEKGSRRVFAGALDWPGWCRSGRDEDSALGNLVDYGPRYAAVMKIAKIPFNPPKDPDQLSIVEELKGDSSTDYGVPGKAPSIDGQPLRDRDLEKLISMLRAAWTAFDEAADSAGSQPLRKGPRGGGRDVPKMRKHVVEGDWGYLTSLGGKFEGVPDASQKHMDRLRAAFVDALAARARGELPDKGPRGGQRWTSRYAVRRSAWHALDHTWEIEDRLDTRGG